MHTMPLFARSSSSRQEKYYVGAREVIPCLHSHKEGRKRERKNMGVKKANKATLVPFQVGVAKREKNMRGSSSSKSSFLFRRPLLGTVLKAV